MSAAATLSSSPPGITVLAPARTCISPTVSGPLPTASPAARSSPPALTAIVPPVRIDLVGRSSVRLSDPTQLTGKRVVRPRVDAALNNRLTGSCLPERAPRCEPTSLHLRHATAGKCRRSAPAQTAAALTSRAMDELHRQTTTQSMRRTSPQRDGPTLTTRGQSLRPIRTAFWRVRSM